jgi:hypothetical protein
MTGAIANTFIRNLAMYQYLVLENPKESIELHIAEVQTPLLPLPPLCEGVDPNEVVQDEDLLETASSHSLIPPPASVKNAPLTNRSGAVKGSSPKSTTSKTSGASRK